MHEDKDMARHSAELVWVEDPSGGLWRGRLLNEQDARDRRARPGARLRYWATVRHTAATGPFTYALTTQGDHPGSRRYRFFDTLDAAQAAGIAWARRRFYVED